jgi:hypothetical protein
VKGLAKFQTNNRSSPPKSIADFPRLRLLYGFDSLKLRESAASKDCRLVRVPPAKPLATHGQSLGVGELTIAD